MALINCPECNNECSSSALTCPKCGHPFKNSEISAVNNEQNEKPLFGSENKTSNKWKILTIVAGIIVIIGIIVLGLVGFAGYQIYSNYQESETANLKSQANKDKATPTPKTTPYPAAINALKSLHRMASATEVGLNFPEYGKRLIDLKADIDENLRQLPEGELKNEINLSLEAYVDAGIAWNEMLEYDFMLTKFEPANRLQKKYSIPAQKSSVGGLQVNRQVALSIIWAAASKHIEQATKLVNNEEI